MKMGTRAFDDTKVAILLATYNGSAYLREFLDSLLMQSMKEFVLYVRDDGSTDATLDILREYLKHLDMRLIPSGGRLGPAGAFFALMQAAGDKHDVLLFADQDDYWYADKTERAVSALTPYHQTVALYCSRLEYVDVHLGHLKFSPLPKRVSIENAAVQNIAIGCTVAITGITRDRVLAGRPHDFIMHDWWLYLFCTAFGTVIYDPNPSIKYRQHEANTIGAATNFLDEIQRRIRRFLRQNRDGHCLSTQVEAFVHCYGKEMGKPRLRLLQRLVTAKNSFATRVDLAIRPGVARQTKFDTIALRLLFLLGRY